MKLLHEVELKETNYSTLCKSCFVVELSQYWFKCDHAHFMLCRQASKLIYRPGMKCGGHSADFSMGFFFIVLQKKNSRQRLTELQEVIV